MTKIYVILIILLSQVSLINPMGAQICELQLAQVLHEDQLRDAVKMEVDIPKEDLKDAFNDFIRSELNVNLKGYGFLTRKDEVYTEIETLPTISPKPIKLIGLFQESAGHTLLFLLGQREGGDFMTQITDSVDLSSLLRFGDDFLQFYLPVYYNGLVEEANEKFEDASDDLKKKEEDIKKNEEDLIKLKQEILELENEIMEAKKEAITLQSNVDKFEREARTESEKLQAALDALKRIDQSLLQPE